MRCLRSGAFRVLWSGGLGFLILGILVGRGGVSVRLYVEFVSLAINGASEGKNKNKFEYVGASSYSRRYGAHAGHLYSCIVRAHS